MTNLLIGYPDINRQALTIDNFGDWAATFPIDNFRGGFKPTRVQSFLIDSETEIDLTFRLAEGFGQPANFIYIAELYKEVAERWGDGLRLSHSDDGSSWTDVIDQDTLFTSQYFTGRDSLDYFRTFTETAEKEHWRIRYDALTTAKRVNHACLMLGKFLDLSADFNSWTITTNEVDQPLVSDSGTYHFNKTSYQTKVIDCVWQGISLANAKLFEEKILRQKEHSCFLLYSTIKDFVIGGTNNMLVRLESASITKNYNSDWNTITARFEEE
jgi:hypothetical protein